MGMNPRHNLAQARAFYAEELRFVSGGSSAAVEAAFARVPRNHHW